MYLKWVVLTTTVALLAHKWLAWHERYCYHKERAAQFESLLRSEVCTDPQTRLQSVDVNNCNLAQQHVDSSLGPGFLALLETAQMLHVCAGEMGPDGQVANRCESLVAALVNASFRIVLLLLACLCALVWVWRQYSSVTAIRQQHLPLDYAAYPVENRLPPWLRE
jgi:hypothetical protein